MRCEHMSVNIQNIQLDIFLLCSLTQQQKQPQDTIWSIYSWLTDKPNNFTVKHKIQCKFEQ